MLNQVNLLQRGHEIPSIKDTSIKNTKYQKCRVKPGLLKTEMLCLASLGPISRLGTQEMDARLASRERYRGCLLLTFGAGA